VNKAKAELWEGIDTADRLVEDVVQRNNDILNYEKKPKLVELYKKVLDEERKADGDIYYDDDGKEIDPKLLKLMPWRETAQSLKEEVNQYGAVVESLRKKTEVIEGNIATEAKTNKMLVTYTDGKKEELASVTKKNLRLSYEIEDLAEKLEILKLNKQANQKSLFLTEASHNNKLHTKSLQILTKSQVGGASLLGGLEKSSMNLNK
jgi:hypothetical protein